MTKKEREALKDGENGLVKVSLCGSNDTGVVYNPATINHRVSLVDRQDMWKEPLTSEYRFGFFSYFKDSPREVK